MEWRELAYRTGQWLQARSMKKEMGAIQPSIACVSTPGILPVLQTPVEMTREFDILGIPFDPATIENWTFDVLTQKTFPLCYARELDIRTGSQGSAKHVWEMNRMLFLPRLALLYRQTGDIMYVNEILRLVTSWTVQNPYLTGINWYSNIEVNIRLINWFLTWELLQLEELMKTDPAVRRFAEDIWIPAIYQHCRFSYAHPSLYSSANNHLIAEYAGLFIAAAKWKFDGCSERWLSYAARGLEREIVRQHSCNGINKEEAAEYIQFITDFLLLSMIVGDRIQQPFSSLYKHTCKNILYYIRQLLTMSGTFPKYGDEDDGRVFALNRDLHDNNFLSLLEAGSIYFREPDLATGRPGPDQKNRILLGEAAAETLAALPQPRPSRSSKFYPDEGHFIFRKRDRHDQEIYCHFDAAPLGYLSIAAHGHADALSFVLYVDGQPVLIDPGTYCYHTDAHWRRYFVSTRAHNTICIDGMNQARFVGPTLWRNHYKTTVQEHRQSDEYDCVIAKHNGYRNIRVFHTRKVEFFRSEDRMTVTDFISNKTNKRVMLEMPFHLHPDTACEMEGPQATLITRNRRMSMKLDDQLKWNMTSAQATPCLGWYSESFYRKTPCPVILGSLPIKGSLVLKTDIVIH